MSARRVCLISAEYPPAPGGVGDYTACLAAALADAGREVHVITARDSTGSSGAAPAGTPPTPNPQPPTPNVDSLARAAPGVTVHRAVTGWGWGCWAEIAGVLRRVGPAVAVIQYQTGAYALHGAINLLPWRLRGLPGVTWVTTFHDLREPYLFPKAGRLRRWANAALMGASRAIVVTNPQDEAAVPPWARARAAGIPIGANIAPGPPAGWDRAAVRAAYGSGPGTTVIAYFGFFNASKGLASLVDALAALRGAGGDVRLLLAGGGPGASDPTNAATTATLRQQIAARRLEGAVHWTGYLDPARLSAALLSADIAALPFADGASLRRGSLLAVLAHGLPVVTTTPAPVPPTLTRWPALVDGVNVLLVPPGDPAALAAALAHLAADPALRARLAAGAQALAAEFTWPQIAARYGALFARLSAEC